MGNNNAKKLKSKIIEDKIHWEWKGPKKKKYQYIVEENGVEIEKNHTRRNSYSLIWKPDTCYVFKVRVGKKKFKTDSIQTVLPQVSQLCLDVKNYILKLTWKKLDGYRYNVIVKQDGDDFDEQDREDNSYMLKKLTINSKYECQVQAISLNSGKRGELKTIQSKKVGTLNAVYSVKTVGKKVNVVVRVPDEDEQKCQDHPEHFIRLKPNRSYKIRLHGVKAIPKSCRLQHTDLWDNKNSKYEFQIIDEEEKGHYSLKIVQEQFISEIPLEWGDNPGETSSKHSTPASGPVTVYAQAATINGTVHDMTTRCDSATIGGTHTTHSNPCQKGVETGCSNSQGNESPRKKKKGPLKRIWRKIKPGKKREDSDITYKKE